MTQPTGFAMVPRWLVERSDVSDRAVRTFALLSGHIEQDGISLRQQEIADVLGVSWRSAHRALIELRDLGVLSWTEPDGNLDGVVYTLLIDRRGLEDTPVRSVTSPLTNSDTPVTSDLSPMTPVSRLPYRESLDTSLRSVTRATTKTTSDPLGFDDWYEPFPKKVGRGAAVKAYRAAAKKVGERRLIEALQEQLPKLREDHQRGYCPNPATWLNQERWLDEAPKPEQPRGPRLVVVDEIPPCPLCPEQRLHRHTSDGSTVLR